MPEIRILPEHIANQIAAGEVVEGPSSIIKELVENSIDAQATKIIIEISKNLRQIQVIDDGLGMSSEDLKLAFKKHATSKISSIEDLYKLITNGFRGEALASISAVSKLTCTSKRTEDEHASKIYIENGSETLSQTGANRGTNIIVDELFFNTPARLKFLKSDKKEKNNIIDITRALALAHSDISFQLIIDGQVQLKSSGSKDLKTCIVEIFKNEDLKKLIPVNFKRDGLELNGFISNLDQTRSDKRNIFTSINLRAVNCYIIRSAIESTYKRYLGPGKYPFVVLDLKIDPGDVDVNVHPNKKEVKYKNTNLVFNFVGDATAKALADAMYQSAHSFQPTLEQNFITNSSPKPSESFNSALTKNSTHYTNPSKNPKQENLLLNATNSAAMEMVKSHFEGNLEEDPTKRSFYTYDKSKENIDTDQRKFIGRFGSVDILLVSSTVPQTIISSQGNKTSFDLVIKKNDFSKSLLLRGDFVGESWIKDKYLEFLNSLGEQILEREVLETFFKEPETAKSRPNKKPKNSDLEQVWERDYYTCVYCAKALLHPETVKSALALSSQKNIINSHLASFDHHLPASKFTSLNEDTRNLFACCQDCNRKKSDSLASLSWNPHPSNAWAEIDSSNPLKIGDLQFSSSRHID